MLATHAAKNSLVSLDVSGCEFEDLSFLTVLSEKDRERERERERETDGARDFIDNQQLTEKSAHARERERSGGRGGENRDEGRGAHTHTKKQEMAGLDREIVGIFVVAVFFRSFEFFFLCRVFRDWKS